MDNPTPNERISEAKINGIGNETERKLNQCGMKWKINQLSMHITASYY